MIKNKNLLINFPWQVDIEIDVDSGDRGLRVLFIEVNERPVKVIGEMFFQTKENDQPVHFLN